jgi:hypothetical protein
MSKPNVKIISISAKCSDLCFVSARDEKGEVIAERDGYVPNFMPDEHWGDYIILDIDRETGQILNWKVPSSERVLKDLK